ncbi:MAG TPA: hypothetical protein VMT00_12965 [Thermoanaerobaculia bacterium]|nr:hypothetical protein [Thermoanaerobaculia bacterium]
MKDNALSIPGLSGNEGSFPFRPWVRRAGLSILLVAALVTMVMLAALLFPGARYGWVEEPFAWIYVLVLWVGAVRISAGTLRPVAELRHDSIVIRPLHQFRSTRVAWDRMRGTERTLGGDRLIVYYDTPRGLRFVALNLNLVKGRRAFMDQLDAELEQMGFVEKTVERSLYRTRG